MGGRRGLNRPPPIRNLPEVFVENEENIRYRKERSPTNKQSPGLKARVERIDDSGFSGGWNQTASSTSSRLEDPSFKDHSSSSSNLWDSFASPVLNIKKKIAGRSSFIEEPIKFQVDPQNVVTGILLMVVLSSVCFSLFVGVNLNNLNGKLSSVKFGAERRILNLKINEQIIDYDIKDESGNVLGGKKAAIQFAYNKLAKAEILKTETKVTGDQDNQVHADRTKRDTVKEPVAQKVETIVSDPVPTIDAQSMNQLSILELSKKIEELNFLVKGEEGGAEVELDTLETTIERLRERKKDLVKKLQKSGKVKPQNLKAKKAADKLAKAAEAAAKENPTAPSKEKTTSKQFKAAKQPKTKVKNPLTGTTLKTTKASKAANPVPKEAEKEAAAAVDDDGEAGVEDAEDGPDDVAEDAVDDADSDYPDDPNFR